MRLRVYLHFLDNRKLFLLSFACIKRFISAPAVAPRDHGLGSENAPREEVEMRHTPVLRLVLLGAGALLILSPFTRGAEEAETVARSFSFSSDPDVAILTVTNVGGLSGKRSVYTLHGDGRLELTRSGSPEVVYESTEASLTYDETRDLLAVAVDHGLLDISQEELLASVKDPAVIADAGTMIVELRLTSYTRNGEELGSVSNILRLTEPWALRRWNPDNTAIAGMAELSGRLSDYRARLGKGDGQ